MQRFHYCSNTRTDNYGVTPENMSRFCLDVIKACGDLIGFDKVGIRLSPGGHLNSITTVSADALVFEYLLKELNSYNIAYVHTGAYDDSLMYKGLSNNTMTEFMRKYYSGTLIACGGYNKALAESGIINDRFDLVAIGRAFIANNDLIDKWQNGAVTQSYTAELLQHLF